jgi:SAM-dependent methyltransferase
MTETSFQLTGSAPERYETFVAPIMAPFVDALLDAANLRAGSAVLDLACGTGFVARFAAARVGSSGRIVGVDINEAMLETAAACSATIVPTIEWRRANAEQMPLPDQSFDAVVCQQGMQFFSNLERAVAEAARLTRRGGRVVATVWAPLEHSPYFHAQVHAIEVILGTEAAASVLGAFSCPADRLTRGLAAVGMDHIEHHDVAADIRLGPLTSFLRGHLSALPWGAALAQARSDGVQEASRIIIDLLDPFASGDSITVPFMSVLVSATRVD